MSRLSIKLGFWSALLGVIIGICNIIGIIIVMMVIPIPSWTNLADFMTAVQPASLTVMTCAQILAFLSGPFVIIVFCCLHEYASDDRKVLTRIGIGFTITAIVLVNQMYFVHFSSMWQIISKGILPGMEHFVEWNPNSAIKASGILGWPFFIGLANIIIAPIFSGGRLERWIRYTSLISGICYVLGAVGIVFEIVILQAIYFIGALVGIIGTVMITILFKRLNKKS